MAKALPGITFTSVRPPSFFQNIGNYSSYTIKNQGAFYLPFGSSFPFDLSEWVSCSPVSFVVVVVARSHASYSGDAKYSEIDARDVGEVIAVAVTDPAHQGKILVRLLALCVYVCE